MLAFRHMDNDALWGGMDGGGMGIKQIASCVITFILDP